MSKGDQRKGLYRKWNVERLEYKRGKHANCYCFVLDLKHDKFSIPALEAYVKACETEYPGLAKDLRKVIALHSKKKLLVKQ